MIVSMVIQGNDRVSGKRRREICRFATSDIGIKIYKDLEYIKTTAKSPVLLSASSEGGALKALAADIRL